MSGATCLTAMVVTLTYLTATVDLSKITVKHSPSQVLKLEETIFKQTTKQLHLQRNYFINSFVKTNLFFKIIQTPLKTCVLQTRWYWQGHLRAGRPRRFHEEMGPKRRNLEVLRWFKRPYSQDYEEQQSYSERANA